MVLKCKPEGVEATEQKANEHGKPAEFQKDGGTKTPEGLGHTGRTGSKIG